MCSEGGQREPRWPSQRRDLTAIVPAQKKERGLSLAKNIFTLKRDWDHLYCITMPQPELWTGQVP